MKTFLSKKFFNTNCRLIFFQTLNKTTIFPLQKTLTATFPDARLFLPTLHSGIIIEEKTTCSLSKLEQLALLTTLHDDLPIEITFFYLPFRLVDTDFLTIFPKIETIFSHLLNHDRYTPIFTLSSAFFKMYQRHEQAYYTLLIKLLLAPVINEPELLHTVKFYIENFSNATTTAKEQFIHRNSLLYRLNKFCQKTEIDLKNYQESITTYLAITSLNS